MYICIYVCMYVYVYMCVCICVYMYVCMHVCIYIYIPSPPGKLIFQNCTIQARPKPAGEKKARYPLDYVAV